MAGKTIDDLGRVGDEQHDKLVEDITKYEEYYRGMLAPLFKQMVTNWKIYLGNRPDPRLEHEKSWRSNVHVPWGYSGIETQVAAVCDIMLSVDPPIQPDPVGLEDERGGTKMGRLMGYFTRRMRWPSKLDVACRESGIQGSAVRKATWISESRPYDYKPTQGEMDAFDEAVYKAQRDSGTEAPRESIEEMALWVDTINATGKFGRIPEAPIAGKRELFLRRGPGWEDTPIFNLRFDPMVSAPMQRQFRIVEEVVKPLKWVLDRIAQAGPDGQVTGLFDERQVKAAMGGGGEFPGDSSDALWSTHEAEIARMLGIQQTGLEHPMYAQRALLWEVWTPDSPWPYCIVMNKKTIININPGEMPYWHRQNPYHMVRNVIMPGKTLGLAEMTQAVPLYLYMDTLRNLRLDALTLMTLPILLKQKTVGLPSTLRKLIPGMILDLTNIDGIKSLNEHLRLPPAAFREESEIKADVDELQATQDIVRGASAPFSRTTASEVQNRLNRAMARQKQRVLRIEDDISYAIPQWQMLCYQFAPSDWRVRVGGSDPEADPFQQYSRSEFLEAVEMDYRFRGATNAINRELRTQQLTDIFARAAQAISVLSPVELRALLRRVYDSTGQRGITEIFTSKGDQFVDMATQAQMMQMQPPPPEEGGEGGTPPA